MPTNLQSGGKSQFEPTGRTIGSPPLFKILDPDIQERLLAQAIARDFADGQIIQQHGDEPTGFWIIKSGQVKMGRFDAEGDMRAVLILGPEDSFGEMAVLGTYPRVVDAVAVGEVRLLWVSDSHFLSIVENTPGALRDIVRIFAEQLQEALNLLVAVSKMPVKKRLARMLVTLCGDRPAPVSLSLRHAEMAEFIGVSRMTIAKILTDLEKEGMIRRGYRQLIIQDPALLAAWMRNQ